MRSEYPNSWSYSLKFVPCNIPGRGSTLAVNKQNRNIRKRHNNPNTFNQLQTTDEDEPNPFDTQNAFLPGQHSAFKSTSISRAVVFYADSNSVVAVESRNMFQKPVLTTDKTIPAMPRL